MNVIYLDCFSGISGDMTIGALLDAGASYENLQIELAKLNIGGYHLAVERQSKNGIMGTDFDVHLHEHHHSHEHGHGDGHNHSHGRNYSDIKNLIENSALTDRVKKQSIAIFEEIAKAEATVHGKTIDEVHFHEVGAVDSIVDIVGVAICLENLEIEQVYCSALHDGQGTIKCAHGEMPVPVPAVMQMLKDSEIPFVIENINTELITPTGMGIVKTLSCSFGPMPNMVVKNIGYGFGKRDTGRFNALRVVVGEINEQQSIETVCILETNIDNISPEITGYVFDKLFENGALDVFQTPIMMKKNRLANMLSVVCALDKADALINLIHRETGSLGVRKQVIDRSVLPRETLKVETKWGEANVKVSKNDRKINVTPEFEDCRNIALVNDVTLKEVYEEIGMIVSDCPIEFRGENI